MSNPIANFAAALSEAANLSHRATTGQPVTIGRSVFSADEIKPVLAALKAPAAPDPRDAIIAELVAAATRVHQWSERQAAGHGIPYDAAMQLAHAVQRAAALTGKREG